MMPPIKKAAPAAVIPEETPAHPLFSRTQGNGKRWSTHGGILLTGGTGFLGRELLERLLAHGGSEPIYLLIRGRNNSEAQRRFLSLYNSLGPRCSNSDRKRIRPLRGNVALPWLGLDRKQVQDLASRITRIIHLAASINLNASLEEARSTNLEGAWEILRLAASCRRLESLAWISTAFVAGDRKGRILEEELQCGQKFRNAYEQSKFEAELLVRSFEALLPITIFRPSIIVGDSRDGYTCNFSSIYWPLRLVAEGELRRVPGAPLTPLDLVPVDYVADAIVELVGRQSSVGLCYQLVAGHRGTITVRELLNRAIRYFDCRGKPLRFISPCTQTSVRLRVFFDYLDDCKEFDDSAARAALQDTGLRCPRITGYLERLFAFCERTNWGEQSGVERHPFHFRPRPSGKGVAIC
jgi:thioester reductase-like protein